MRRLRRLALLVLVGAISIPQLAAADELARLTKELTILAEKYRAADGQARPTLLTSLHEKVHARAELLKTTAQTDPETLLHDPLPSSTYDLLPAELRQHVERPLTLEGTIESQAGSATNSSYRLRDRQGRAFQLVAVGKTAPFVNGSTVRVSGLQLGAQLLFRGTDLMPLSRSAADTQPPTVTIVKPARGAAVRGQVTVEVRAEDNQRVAQIELLKDGTLVGAREGGAAELMWDTTREADGPHTLTARAHDVDLNISATPSLTLLVDNTPPRIRLASPLPRQAISEIVPLVAEAADAIGLEVVKFLVDGRVVGVSVSAPYTFNWNTATASNGLHTLEALAVDRAQNTTTSEPVEVRVLNANRAPVLHPIGSHTIHESLNVQFVVTGSDPDGERDPLTVRASNLPPWGTFDPSTRTFSGTPDFTEASLEQPEVVYPDVRFEVCDSQPLCAHETITITVINVNRPPTMEPLGKHTIREGQPLTITPVIADPDHDVLACSGVLLPPWLELDQRTCALHGVPPLGLLRGDQPARAYPTAIVKVCDPAGLCDAQLLIVQVANMQRKPTLERIGDQRTEERRLLSFAVRATDPDGDPVKIAATDLPTHATFEDGRDGTGFFRWTPAHDQAGSYFVTFKTTKTTDPTLEDEETIAIDVRETFLTISGHLTGDQDKPFTQATVEISRAGTVIQRVKPDAEGYYFATQLSPAKYIVRPVPQTTGAPSGTVVHFTPLSRSVELATTDEADVDFRVIVETD